MVIKVPALQELGNARTARMGGKVAFNRAVHRVRRSGIPFKSAAVAAVPLPAKAIAKVDGNGEDPATARRPLRRW